jgi:hypothetical protein
MSKNKTDKFLEKALDKMFQAVGLASWDRELTKKQNWYMEHSWTEEQIDEYKKWFVRTAIKDLKLNKQLALKEWSWFFLMWGWTQTKQEEAQA